MTEPQSPPPGLFLNFEGTEGCGKSTQLRLLGERLRLEGYQTLETAEPGGTPIGAQIRRILLDPANQELSPTAELLLYFASRAQNVDQRIAPALASGVIVLTDRFTDSSMAYQGYARGLGAQTVRDLDRIACRGLEPDITFLFDIHLETGLGRARSRNVHQETTHESRMDEQALEFHRRVQDAYHRMAAAEPHRFRILDANADPATIHHSVWSALAPLLPATAGGAL
ncbi:MAG: dTMP kinase [Acidobacteria bacterium]|nr:dTMP kinase [Acidobacteriota bacterium]